MVVVGGGCVGVGVAWEASTRGLKVALVERGDFSSGTSGRSTKLIHGGIRYLEAAFKNLDKGMFDLVTEALDEVGRMRPVAGRAALCRAGLIHFCCCCFYPFCWPIFPLLVLHIPCPFFLSLSLSLFLLLLSSAPTC